MPETSGLRQLQIRYPQEHAWHTVEVKGIIKVGLSTGSSIASLMMTMQEEDHGDMLADLIPGFSKPPDCKTEDHYGKSPDEAVNLIVATGIERKLNTVVIPSVDIRFAMTGVTMATFAVGILTSVPEGKKPQVFVGSGAGDSLKKALANAIRVRPERAGCFIATVCYGSPESHEVVTLQRFRDETLMRSRIGRVLVRTYYFLSPPIARVLEKSGLLRGLVRRYMLGHIVRICGLWSPEQRRR